MSKLYPDTNNYISLENAAEYWARLKPENNIASTEEEIWKVKAEFLDKVSLQNNVVVFVTNIYTGRYIYMSDKVNVLAGLEPSLYTNENGLQFSFSRFHPDQIEGLLYLNQFALSYFADNELYKRKNAFLSLTYLYKNGNGEYVQVLQRGIILEMDTSGKPIIALNIVHYVGHSVKQGSLSCIITVEDKIDIYSFDSARNLEKPTTFSQQERKILKMLAKGMATKAIAKECFISPHTVDNHRRNIIKKTGCIDTTGAVAFAQLINLI